MKKNFENWRIFTLNVGKSVSDGDWNWSHVRSPFARIYYVEEGMAEVVIHGESEHTIVLQPGRLYLIPPFTEHTDRCSGHFVHYYIHVYEEPHGDNFLDDMDFPYELEARDVDVTLFKLLAELNPSMRLLEYDPKAYDNHSTLQQNLLVNRQRELFNKVESRGILYVLISRFLMEARPKSDIKDARIQEAVQYVKENITESISIDQLASVACLSPDHFIRLFKKEVGETPNIYINRRKMERAELLLVTTDMTIKEIAGSLDYLEPAYFNRVFTKYVGITPQRYRLSQR